LSRQGLELSQQAIAGPLLDGNKFLKAAFGLGIGKQVLAS
jgi:hypothetical protein